MKTPTRKAALLRIAQLESDLRTADGARDTLREAYNNQALRLTAATMTIAEQTTKIAFLEDNLESRARHVESLALEEFFQRRVLCALGFHQFETRWEKTTDESLWVCYRQCSCCSRQKLDRVGSKS